MFSWTVSEEVVCWIKGKEKSGKPWVEARWKTVFQNEKAA